MAHFSTHSSSYSTFYSEYSSTSCSEQPQGVSQEYVGLFSEEFAMEKRIFTDRFYQLLQQEEQKA